MCNIYDATVAIPNNVTLTHLRSIHNMVSPGDSLGICAGDGELQLMHKTRALLFKIASAARVVLHLCAHLVQLIAIHEAVTLLILEFAPKFFALN